MTDPGTTFGDPRLNIKVSFFSKNNSIDIILMNKFRIVLVNDTSKQIPRLTTVQKIPPRSMLLLYLIL